MLIRDLITERYASVLDKHCHDALSSLKSLTVAIGQQEGIAFEDVEKDIEINYTKKYQAVGSGLGAAVGSGVGFFFGGPVGASIGASIGGLAGGQVAKIVDAKEIEKVVVGDNRELVKTSLFELGQKTLEEKLKGLEGVALNQLFYPLKTTFSTISKETSKLEQYIREQRNV
ncbi:hypothetical protein CGI17_25240 [Vibrio parahaemolyticus]|nr:hypothetical protein CGI17_25240 [Vibrio parahaemolyticus]